VLVGKIFQEIKHHLVLTKTVKTRKKIVEFKLVFEKP
jgi:hypothetical protein